MKCLTTACFATLLCCSLAAADFAAAHEPPNVKSLPANQWVERSMSGWPGKTEYGNVLRQGFSGAGDLGVAVLDLQITRPGAALVRTLDSNTGKWTEFASADLPPAYEEVSSGRKTDGNLHGMQTCFDSDRNVLVGLTSTDLNGQGRTVEFDLASKTATGHKPDPSPPVVTAASLCYDPVNQEVVLATGGFSPVGGTDGTWLYDGRKKSWHKLETPAVVDDVRLPLEKARDQLITLRWLVWKNLEFCATGREKLLDDRSKAKSLSKETTAILAELQHLATVAQKNSAIAERPYHAHCLAAAAKLLGDAAGKLQSAGDVLKSFTPAELEPAYREHVVPALTLVETAVADLAVAPPPRMSARLVYDAKNKVIVCFGGDGQRCEFGDTWVYHCDGRWWQRQRPAVHPAPASARAMAYDSNSGVTVLLRPANRGGRRLGWESWSYDAAKNQWQPLNIVGGDNEIFWFEYDASAGCLVAFNLNMSKAWLLRLDLSQIEPAKVDKPHEPMPEVVWVDATGEFVLRDTASLADLERWQAAMDQWVASVPNNMFVPVPTHGTGRPNWGRTWSSIVYDADRRQIYYRDGGHGSYHGAVTDHYDLPTGRWFRSDLRDEPPWPMGSYFGWGRAFSMAPWCVHSYKYHLFYNPLNKHLQRWIGQSGRMEGISGNVLDYDPDTGRWARDLYSIQELKDSQWMIPGAPDRLIRVGPWLRYNPKPTTAVWQRTAGGESLWPETGPLPYQYAWDGGACFFFDTKRNRAMYYGGPKGKPGLFALDLNRDDPKWEKIEFRFDSEVPPEPGREIVYIPHHDAFLMLAGEKQQKLVEIWSLDARDYSFHKVALKNPPPDARVSQGLQYDPVADLCFYIAASNGPPQMHAFRFSP